MATMYTLILSLTISSLLLCLLLTMRGQGNVQPLGTAVSMDTAVHGSQSPSDVSFQRSQGGNQTKIDLVFVANKRKWRDRWGGKKANFESVMCAKCPLIPSEDNSPVCYDSSLPMNEMTPFICVYQFWVPVHQALVSLISSGSQCGIWQPYSTQVATPFSCLLIANTHQPFTLSQVWIIDELRVV